MDRRVRLVVATASLAGVVVLIVAGTQPTSAAGGDRLFQMTIHNDEGNRALSDEPLSDSTTYTDYQWNPPSQADVCVFATVYSTGMAYTGLNRRQGFADNLWCNQHFDSNGDPFPDRYYTLLVGDQTACDFLEANNLIPPTETLPCTLVPDREPRTGGFQPHVRLETLFKNKAKTTPVRFQFELADGRQYSVDADAEAKITTLTADQKIVTYAGTASFRNFSTGKIGNSFSFPFTLEFKRQ